MPHLRVENSGKTEPYTSVISGRSPLPPPRNREQHAAKLLAALDQAITAGRHEVAQRETAIAEGEAGFYLQVALPPGRDAAEAIDKLGNRQGSIKKHIEVVSVTGGEDGAPIQATVFVPAASESYYRNKIDAYRSQNTNAGNPKHEALVARMEEIHIANIQTLFTDSPALFPASGQQVWWEVWLRQGARERFTHVADQLRIRRKAHIVSFREREVMLALADEAAMTRLIRNCDAVAELRIAKDTPARFMDMGGAEQRDWSEEALSRISPPSPHAPAICLLDSGVTQGHPLIRGALAPEDMHSFKSEWGVADRQGHGTAMSGVALYGDLHPLFAGSAALDIQHRLESVKILPPERQENEPDLYGCITKEAVARAEIQAPKRHRVICMAVTSEDKNGTRGCPSSWSSTVDQLCFDEDNQRLVVLSAGNIRDDLDPAAYPDRNDLEPVEDPAQAWNALTVGAYTDKVNITELDYAGWRPVAPAGDLSPSARTSVVWNRQWPIKPDVVFEGGNYATDGVLEPEPFADLQLLTTHWNPTLKLLDTFGDTSGATALAANMAARIMASRPNMWPETVRGLIVHSAEWTEAMWGRMEGCNKTELASLLRRYGYGAPDLDRALLSANNDLTMLVEDKLQPFDMKPQSSTISTRDMRLHRLPWPRNELRSLGATPVEFRITLSYFIEPNPGERGWTRRHRYASHSLRFVVKRATETVDEFRRRINKVAQKEEEGVSPSSSSGEDDKWLLGDLIRNKGSLHSDWWRGTAADLADRDAVGVFPVGGWWKEKPYLDRWNSVARYSLIVTIRAPGAAIDLYTPVKNMISIPTEIKA